LKNTSVKPKRKRAAKKNTTVVLPVIEATSTETETETETET